MTSTSSLPGTKIAGIVAVKVVPRPGSLIDADLAAQQRRQALADRQAQARAAQLAASPGRPSWTNSSKTRDWSDVEARAGVATAKRTCWPASTAAAEMRTSPRSVNFSR